MKSGSMAAFAAAAELPDRDDDDETNDPRGSMPAPLSVWVYWCRRCGEPILADRESDCDVDCPYCPAGQDEDVACAMYVANTDACIRRLTRDRERLTGYVRAALQLSRAALTHIVEDRPEEAARTIFRAICALASAVEEGDGR